jgi:hypothetical protein
MNKYILDRFSVKSAKELDYESKVKPINNTTPSRIRVIVSKKATDCLDFLRVSIPMLFNVDPIDITSRQDAMRFSVQYLYLLAHNTGIDERNLKRKYAKFFEHTLLHADKPDEFLDLTPATAYEEPGTDEKTNLTFFATQDGAFLLLKSLYRQKGVKSNNHLVEEIIFSMAACVMAFSAGYEIKGMKACHTLDGFGGICLEYDPTIRALWEDEESHLTRSVTDLQDYQHVKRSE